VLLIDTREQNPLDCSRFAGWFAAIEKRALALGDFHVVELSRKKARSQGALRRARICE
jgi:hypothetical protein